MSENKNDGKRSLIVLALSTIFKNIILHVLISDTIESVKCQTFFYLLAFNF